MKKNIVEVKERNQYALPEAIRIQQRVFEQPLDIIGFAYRNLEDGLFPRSRSAILREFHGQKHGLMVAPRKVDE